MRILYMGLGDCLVGRHLPQSWPDRLMGDHVGRHEILTFGYGEDLDIELPLEAGFDAVLEQLPEGWVPDVCICVHVDYLQIPKGIEDAPFPTVAVTADWDYRLGVAKTMVEAFDLTVGLGDASCAALRDLGARHTIPNAYFGVPEKTLGLEEVPVDSHRPIDVLFTGTIDDNTHLDRSRWLHRLAQLSDKYNIHVTDGASAQSAYQKLLKRTKIVFTFHRRGELQLRFTDAVMQGAAVLDNGVETAKYFDKDSEFLYYDDDTLESVIEEHLAEPQKIHAKVEAARRTTREHFGSLKRMEGLFDEIEEFLSKNARGPRPAQVLSRGEKARRSAEQLYLSHFNCSMDSSNEYLELAMQDAAQADEGPRKLNDLAVIYSSAAIQRKREPEVETWKSQGSSYFEELTTRYPQYSMGWFNRGYAANAADRYEEARHCFTRAYELFASEDADFDPWAFYHHEQDREPQGFGTAHSEALLHYVRTGSDEQLRRILAAICAYFLAQTEFEEGAYFELYERIEIAAELAPWHGEIARAKAHSADVLGYVEEATEAYSQSVDLLPFATPWHLKAIDHYTRAGKLEQAKEALHAVLNVLRAKPGIRHLRESLRFLTTAMSHQIEGTLIVGDALSDRFAVEAIAELIGRRSPHYDPRVDARVAALLEVQGKNGQLAAWQRASEERMRESGLSASESQALITDYVARQSRTNASMRESISSAVRT